LAARVHDTIPFRGFPYALPGEDPCGAGATRGQGSASFRIFEEEGHCDAARWNSRFAPGKCAILELAGQAVKKGPPKAQAPNVLAAGTTMEDGTPVLGNLELKGKFLTLMVNSAARAGRGREMLENVLGKMIGTPLTAIQTIEQLKEVHEGRMKDADDIPLDVATPLVHAMLDKRDILDEPVGMLGNVSPRSAIRTQEGKEKVAE
jgi:hypothetical protein